MSINVDIFEHHSASYFYVVLQHDEVWEINTCEAEDPHSVCKKVGNLWPKGEIGLIGEKFGRHLRIGEVGAEAVLKITQLITTRITHV